MAQPSNGAEQVKTGLLLIRWSHLARVVGNVLHGVDAEDFERHQATVEPEIGRLICWIAFSVGCEFALKGVCNIRGNLEQSKIATTNLSKMRKPLEKTLDTTTAMTLERTLTKVRNRDLHHHQLGVRAADFPMLDEIIPAMNKYLALVNCAPDAEAD